MRNIIRVLHNRFWYKKFAQIVILLLLSFGFAPHAQAHGTAIDLNEVDAVEIHARFDNGDPMANAQVTVYAPTDRAKPWLTGEADEEGHFIFVPNRSLPGQWDVQVRTAGHGDWVYIDIAEGGVTGLTTASRSMTTAQIVMMSAAVIWGFIGTALYFSRPKGGSQAGEEKPVLVT